MLPAPTRRRRHKTVPMAVRADRIRRWLTVAPDRARDLCDAMQCSRFALIHTVRTMPDVVSVRVNGHVWYSLDTARGSARGRAG